MYACNNVPSAYQIRFCVSQWCTSTAVLKFQWPLPFHKMRESLTFSSSLFSSKSLLHKTLKGFLSADLNCCPKILVYDNFSGFRHIRFPRCSWSFFFFFFSRHLSDALNKAQPVVRNEWMGLQRFPPKIIMAFSRLIPTGKRAALSYHIGSLRVSLQLDRPSVKPDSYPRYHPVEVLRKVGE